MEEQEVPKKPTISDSAIRMLKRCPLQYYYRYVESRVVPPGVALIVGKATDDAVSRNLQNKADSGALLPPDMVEDAARDSVVGEWSKGVRLVGDETKESQSKLKGEAVDTAVTLSRLHHHAFAPKINPLPDGVQRYFRLELDGYSMDLTGRIDIEEKTKLRDTKTSKRSPQEDEADKSDQLTIYALGAKVIRGKIPKTVHLDYLIKTKTPKTVELTSRRNQADINQMLKLVERAIESIQTGVFMPNNEGWHCSNRFCGYWDSVCWAGRRDRVMAGQIERKVKESK